MESGVSRVHSKSKCERWQTKTHEDSPYGLGYCERGTHERKWMYKPAHEKSSYRVCYADELMKKNLLLCQVSETFLLCSSKSK